MKSSAWSCQVGDGDATYEALPAPLTRATTIDPLVPATCAIPVCPLCGDSRAVHTREFLPAERPMRSGRRRSFIQCLSDRAASLCGIEQRAVIGYTRCSESDVTYDQVRRGGLVYFTRNPLSVIMCKAGLCRALALSLD